MINEKQLEKRDALGIWDADNIPVTAGSNARILAIEVPMHID